MKVEQEIAQSVEDPMNTGTSRLLLFHFVPLFETGNGTGLARSTFAHAKRNALPPVPVGIPGRLFRMFHFFGKGSHALKNGVFGVPGTQNPR